LIRWRGDGISKTFKALWLFATGPGFGERSREISSEIGSLEDEKGESSGKDVFNVIHNEIYQEEGFHARWEVRLLKRLDTVLYISKPLRRFSVPHQPSNAGKVHGFILLV
jgi:hypothetical protein